MDSQLPPLGLGVIELTQVKKKSMCFKNVKCYKNKNYYKCAEARVELISISKRSRRGSLRKYFCR